MYTYIYGLYDALAYPPTLRYVGKANDVKLRLQFHVQEVDKRNAPVFRWLRKLRDDGRKPKLKILEKCPIEKWKEREQFWIGFYREQFPGSLLNISKGGNGRERGGFQPYCRNCGTERIRLESEHAYRCPKCTSARRKEYMAKWKSENAELKRQMDREYYASHKDKWKISNLQNRDKKRECDSRRYYQRKQAGICTLCSSPIREDEIGKVALCLTCVTKVREYFRENYGKNSPIKHPCRT